MSAGWKPYVPVVVPWNKLYKNILNIKKQWSGIKENDIKLFLGQNPFQIIKVASSAKEPSNKSSETEGGAAQIKPKNKRLTDQQRLQILTMRFLRKIRRPEISQSLHIPYSTVARIIREYEKDPAQTWTWFKAKYVEIPNWNRVEESLREYVESASNVFSSIDVQKYIKDINGLDLSRRDVTNYMKNQLGFSFRRVSGRPLQVDLPKNKYFKTMFWLEFGNLWTGSQVFVNIDEVIFSHSTKHNYSWMKRGEGNTVSNIAFRGSLSMIGSITSTGEMFFYKLKSTNNSQIFREYVTKLINWLWEDLNIEKDKLVIIIDNSPIHWSDAWLMHLNRIGWQIVFLAPYCPQFATIELLFHLLKKKVWKHSRSEVTNLKKKEGDRWIRECLSTITREEIIGMWRHSILKMTDEIGLQNK